MKLNNRNIKWLKYVLHLLAFMPLVWLVLSIQLEWLSADPAKDIQHYTGRMALKLLLLTLAISPLVKITHQSLLMRCRRLIGLWCFFWTCLHLLSYAWFELGFDLPLFVSELSKRFYLTLGIINWLILTILAITSIPKVQRKCAKQWQNIHNCIYLVAILAPIHALLSTKVLNLELLIYAVIALLLLVLRYQKFRGWFKMH